MRGGTVVPKIENVIITKNDANAIVEFDVPTEADAVRIIASPVSGGTNSPLNSVLGNPFATTYDFANSKTITVDVPRSIFSARACADNSEYAGKVLLRGLGVYTVYLFEVLALSGKSPIEIYEKTPRNFYSS